MALELKPFDVADYLTDDITVAEYLRLALESGDSQEIVTALSDVTRARGGIDHLAAHTGLTTGTLQNALSNDGNLDLKTLVKVVAALGVTLSIAAGSTESVAA